jgi:hypothetical protein
VIEVESADYNATVEDGGCCIDNCTSSDSWNRVDRNPCYINITVPEDMAPPIYFYYKLTNFYQNHRRYVRSRNDQQLKGDLLDVADAMTLPDLKTRCTYHYTNGSSIINPCGLIAWSVFNDSFALFADDGSPVALDSSAIAWQSDLDQKFANSEDGTTGLNFPPFAFERSQPCSALPADAQDACMTAQSSLGTEVGWCYPGSGYCTEDHHFVVWMRPAGLPAFRKLYAKIDTPLRAGNYFVRVSNGVQVGGEYVNYATGQEAQRFLYPVGAFGGTKAVVLSTSSWIGGQNFFLGYAYIVVGAICLALAVCFFIKHRLAPRDLGNAPYVSFQKDAVPK